MTSTKLEHQDSNYKLGSTKPKWQILNWNVKFPTKLGSTKLTRMTSSKLKY